MEIEIIPSYIIITLFVFVVVAAVVVTYLPVPFLHRQRNVKFPGGDGIVTRVESLESLSSGRGIFFQNAHNANGLPSQRAMK